MRQGRGPELTGRSVGAVGWRRRASVRAGLKEAVGVRWSRTQVKRRKASVGGVSWLGGSEARFLLVPRAYWRRDRREISATYPGRSVGLRGSVGRRQRRPMAQQKSEDRVLPDGGVMPAQPAVGGQGKAVPVEQTATQLQLPIATAEDPVGSAREAARDRSRAGRAGVPKAVVTAQQSTPARMEEVAERLDSAMKKVVANKGAPGPDGMTVGQLKEHWPSIAPRLRGNLLSGRYQPGGISRGMIPKADGGQRALGIPNVADRVVMEAVRQALEPLFEPTFHASSHGFRPGRSCHTAIAEAKQHVRDGYEWVVDIDLEKFLESSSHCRS